jgi:pilus assembly protein Flp/PilA
MLDYIKARYGIGTSDEGATAVEYGIMVALIAIVIIVAVALLGTNLRDVFSEVAESVVTTGG